MKTASADPARVASSKPVGERAVGADLRALVGDLERAPRGDRQPQHPDLAREREHDDRERDEPEQREREPDRQPALGASAPSRGRSGASASAAASAAARPAEALPTVPFAPKHPHGAPVAAGEDRADLDRGRAGHQQRGGRRGDASIPAPTADAEHQLDRDQRRPHARTPRAASRIP